MKINWSTLWTAIVVLVVTSVGTLMFNSFQTPKTTKEILDIRTKQDEQDKRLNGNDVINAQVNTKLFYIQQAVERIESKLK